MKERNHATDPRLERLAKIISNGFNRKNGPKDHHYVTRAYQQLFATPDGPLPVYDFERAKLDPKGKKGVAFLEGLYAFEDDQGEKRFDVEHALAAIENDALPIIKRLCKGETVDQVDRVTLSFFIAVNMLRTPAALDELQRIYENGVPQMRDYFGSELTAMTFFVKKLNMGLVRAAEHAAVIFGRATLRSGRQGALSLFLMATPIVQNQIFQSHWLILEAPTNASPFIISDAGLTWIAEYPAAAGDFLSPGMQLAFPLSPNYCLVAQKSSEQSDIDRKIAGIDLVTQINEATAANADRYAMGPSGPQLIKVAEALRRKPPDWVPIFAIDVK
jgi:hypothetical protein